LYQQPYRWTDSDGATFTLDRLRGRPAILTLAYGACRKVCSSAVRDLQQMQALADRRGGALQFVVVSIDPQQDTPQDWRAFRRERGLERPNWFFLSGGAADTRALAGDLGVAVWRYHDHVLHDFAITLLDADGNIVRTLRHYDDSLPDFLRDVLPAAP
jgi:protein SCO1/2